MPKAVAIAIELVLFACALWVLCFLSTLLHEVGHALGYLIATGDGRGHIRVGSGRVLLSTQGLTVKLLPFDGCFVPSDTNRIDSRAKAIMVLAGGPAASLLVVVALLLAKLGGTSLRSDIIASSALESLASSALSINLFMLILSVIPAHYFYGEVRGMETDGLQIVNALKDKES